jgi:hypothetical protein
VKLNRRRLDELAAKVDKVTQPGGPLYGMWVRILEERIAFLEHVPEDLQQAVDSRFMSTHEPTCDVFASWRQGPFARWAPPMPANFEFPRALVEFVLNPPARFFFGHACEQCGLSVPICTLWDGKTGPRPDPTPFAACPACGGRTSFAANHRPANQPETEDVAHEA